MTQVSKKIPSILLAALIAVAAAFAIGAVTAQEVHAMSGGDGSQNNPYQIKTYDDLKEFADIVNGTNGKPANPAACAELRGPINCDDKKWVPIGKDRDHQYTGHFDGKNNKIKGLSNAGIEDIDTITNQGLFGYIGKKASGTGTVENVGVEGGNIRGNNYVGGIVGDNSGTVTNCYNTGAVSGRICIGGVAGLASLGLIANCYNAGTVSGTADVGGVVGKEHSDGKITNCYNIGAISGKNLVGGVVGSLSTFGKTTDCYYDNMLSLADTAIGGAQDSYNVKGLTTFQMTGPEAVRNMGFHKIDGEPWLAKANGQEASNAPYYLFYPHLKGFNYDSDGGQLPAEEIAANDWPAKVIVDVDWNESTSYTYNASAQGPTVNKITVSAEPVEVPKGASEEKYRKLGETTWGTDKPTDPGSYELRYLIDGNETIIPFAVLEEGKDGAPKDYRVSYQVKEGENLGTWSAIDAANIINAGVYKAYIALTNLSDGGSMVKDFQITPAKLTITANDQSYVYNGEMQGPGDKTYDNPAELAQLISVEGLIGDDKVNNINIDGQGQEIGEYPLVPSNASLGDAAKNYVIKYVNGTLRITGSKPEPTPPQPEPPKPDPPKPSSSIDKAAAKIALDAGIKAYSSGSKVTASWGNVKGASSYVIYANYCDQKTCKKIKTVSGKTTSIDIKKLNGKKFNPKKNLKFYVVVYKTVKGKKVKLAKSIMAHAPGSKNSKRTNVTGVKVKKASFTLKKGKTAKIRAKLVLEKKNKKPLKHEAKIRYASSNKKVATVSKKGKIKAVGKGKCTVYVYAVSGVSKKVKVTVK